MVLTFGGAVLPEAASCAGWTAAAGLPVAADALGAGMESAATVASATAMPKGALSFIFAPLSALQRGRRGSASGMRVIPRVFRDIGSTPGCRR